MNQDCVFCKIVSNQIPSVKIYEDEEVLAFMDINPIRHGHVNIIPKKHVPYFYQLEERLYQKTMSTARSIGKALNEGLEPERVGIVVEGFEVDHFHVKMTPLESIEDIQTVHVESTPEELKQIAEKIKEKIA